MQSYCASYHRLIDCYHFKFLVNPSVIMQLGLFPFIILCQIEGSFLFWDAGYGFVVIVRVAIFV